MVQKYQNEIPPIFYYGISTKTSEKYLKIPNLQSLTLGRIIKITLYYIQTLILEKCRIKYSWIRMALWFLLEISGGLDGCLSDHCAFQIEFFGYQPWVIIQKLALPLCIFFRQAS